MIAPQSNEAPLDLDYATAETPRPSSPSSPLRHVFSLVVGVIVIGGILYWCLVPRVIVCSSPANRSVTYNTLNHLLFSLDEFYKEYGYYPQGGNSAVVRTLRGEDPASNPKRKDLFYVQDPPGRRPVLDRWGLICDDWGYPLVFRGGDGTTRPTVYSIGADGVDEQGRGDDVLPDPALTSQPTTAPAPNPSASTAPQ